MLHENERAPDFTLPDKVSGGQLAMADCAGESVLVVLVPTAQVESAAQGFLDAAAARSGDLVRRGVSVLMIVAPSVRLRVPSPPDGLHILTDASGVTSRQFDASDIQCCSYVVGPDGRVRLAREGRPDVEDLLARASLLPPPAASPSSRSPGAGS